MILFWTCSAYFWKTKHYLRVWNRSFKTFRATWTHLICEVVVNFNQSSSRSFFIVILYLLTELKEAYSIIQQGGRSHMTSRLEGVTFVTLWYESGWGWVNCDEANCCLRQMKVLHLLRKTGRMAVHQQSAISITAETPTGSTIGVARGGQRGNSHLKFSENIVILCFAKHFSEQNSVIRLNSNILAPRNFWAGYATAFNPTVTFGVFHVRTTSHGGAHFRGCSISALHWPAERREPGMRCTRAAGSARSVELRQIKWRRSFEESASIYNSARIQTALIKIQVSKYHRGKARTVDSARKAFYYRKSISRICVLDAKSIFCSKMFCEQIWLFCLRGASKLGYNRVVDKERRDRGELLCDGNQPSFTCKAKRM